MHMVKVTIRSEVKLHLKSGLSSNNLCPVQDSGSLAVFKVTARDQGRYKGPSGGLCYIL